MFSFFTDFWLIGRVVLDPAVHYLGPRGIGAGLGPRVGVPHCWRSHATALDSIIPSFCTFVP